MAAFPHTDPSAGVDHSAVSIAVPASDFRANQGESPSPSGETPAAELFTPDSSSAFLAADRRSPRGTPNTKHGGDLLSPESSNVLLAPQRRGSTSSATALPEQTAESGPPPSHMGAHEIVVQAENLAVEAEHWMWKKFKEYGRKWLGVPGMRSPPLPHFREIFYGFLGSFAGIGILAALNYNFGALTHASLVMLVASFGATAVLLYGTPTSPLAQPRNVILGHVISAFVGVVVRIVILDIACDDSCTSLASALAVSLAIAVMLATGTIHPPGGATALIAVVGDASIKNLGFLFVVIPAATGALIMLVVALIVNNTLPTRQYPQYWCGLRIGRTGNLARLRQRRISMTDAVSTIQYEQAGVRLSQNWSWN